MEKALLMEGLTVTKGAAFLLGTVGLVAVSRASLAAPRSHGFYRFFAWEAILGMAVLDIAVWFRDPFSWHQLISWPLLVVSAVLVVVGTGLLRQRGELDPHRDDLPLVGVEKTTRLITSGVYRHIRHPLYSSLLFLAWGIFFKDPSWLGGVLALSATGFLVATARVEEAENLRYFGEAYEAYVQNSKMFVPFLF